MKYDYLVVGAGIFGATCARELTDRGKRVLVLERAGHVGGMAHDELRDGIRCSTHGGHIFHTNDRRQWDYVQRFAEWLPQYPIVRAMAKGRLYSFPINLMTLQQVYGLPAITPEAGRALLAGFKNGHTGDNVRDWCLNNIGPELYHLFIEGYTRKMWSKDPAEIPAAIVRRLPIWLDWTDCYSSHIYQGVPVGGFTSLVENMLSGIPVQFGEDYAGRTTYWNEQARRVIYCGPLDALFGFKLGRLEYRSLRWEWETHPVPDYQGCQAVNYCDADVPYTRVLEYKHFWPAPQTPHTVIAREFPATVEETGAAYYPVEDDRNRRLYDQYVLTAARVYPQLRAGGRLGSFKYLDMHQAVAGAQALVEKELS